MPIVELNEYDRQANKAGNLIQRFKVIDDLGEVKQAMIMLAKQHDLDTACYLKGQPILWTVNLKDRVKVYEYLGKYPVSIEYFKRVHDDKEKD